MPRPKLAVLAMFACVTQVGALEINSRFEIPPNSPGSAPLTGGVDQPTRVVFGNPVVEAQFGSLNQSALVFDGRSTYEQIEYRLDGSYRQYHVSFDFESANLNGSSYAFNIFLDSVDVFGPGASDSKSISFHGLGFLGMFNPRDSSGPPGRSFDDGLGYRVSVDVDLAANRWSASYNEQLFFTAPFNSVSDRIHSVRFSLAPWQAGAPDAPEVQAAIDNVHIVAVPEPRSVYLLAVGCCWLLWRAVRQKVLSH
jgi:hypothetical protein